MKAIKMLCLPLLLTVLSANQIQAQFLKNIINTVKQTAQNHADNKTREGTDKAADKAEGVFKKKKTGDSTAGDTGIDTAATNSVLGAFGKAVQDNPNDTNAADIVKKALGNMVGGGGVSKEDSVKAIEAIRKGQGGSGYRIEYIMVMTSKSMNMRDTSVGYITNNGETRSEAMIPMPGNKAKMVMIGRISLPTYSVNLNAADKTFSLNVIDTALIGGTMAGKSTATKVGSETVQGYSCSHAKLTTTTGSGMFKSSHTMDVWVSTEVPGYSLMKSAMAAKNVSPQMIKALNAAGCEGMIVKIAESGKDYTMNMELQKAVKGNFPASMFSIPSDYKNSDQNLISNLF